MDVSNSYSGLVKKNNNDSCIYFQDKALSTYLYIKNYKEINLSQKELEKDFLRSVLSNKTVIALSDIYLNMLKSSELEKFEGLKHDNCFELDEVIDSMSRDLRDNFQKYGIVFFLLEKKSEEDYLKSNPLKEIIDKPYMQAFFDGLELSYSQRILFILGMAQEEWNWLFPDFKTEEYKAVLFCHICELERKDPIAYSRKMNSELIRLGLFSAPWKISSYAYSYFKNENPAFTLQKVVTPRACDIYDYKKTGNLNQEGLEIMRKLNGFMVISSESDYRNKYFLADYYQDCYDELYEFTQMYKVASKAELAFYIYALSLQVKNDALFINKDLCAQLLQKEQENPLEEILHKKVCSSSILEKVKCPVILSMESFTEDDRSKLLNQGIDVLYALHLKLPEKENYEECFGLFCLQEKLRVSLIRDIALECEKLALPPEQWKSVTKLLKPVPELTKEEAIELIRNKFSGKGKSDKLRKNSHYCIEALNTSEPISEVTAALKNADEYQHGQYDEESGIKVLLYGISGGGKTAYPEEVSKKMNRS